HILADADILQLDAIGDGDALVAKFRSYPLRKVEIKDDTAAIRAERYYYIRVHHLGIEIQHQVREHPPVLSLRARAHTRNVLGAGIRRFERAALNAAVSEHLGAIAAVIENTRETGMDVVDVVTAIEIIVDEDLPVARHVVAAAFDPAQTIHTAADPLRHG